ncbi:MAG TPA: S-layer homology domain-containing protein [Symbiobacteriaceae bacterium]|nr:S-layer homology domain-containing protein [Symbiobacteriaceae bacterium]
MKTRKLAALACAALLSLTVAATAAAATVPSAVYGGKGENTPATQVQTNLATYGVKDVPADDWSAGSAVVLLQAGLITPDANGQLNLNAPLSYNTTMGIFAKVLGIASKTDDDATATAKATQAGLAGAADANGNISRLQFAKILATALGVQPSSKPTLAFNDTLGLSAADNGILLALKDLGIFKGFEDGTFRADSTLTLAQVAVLIDRILSAQ